MQRFIFSLFTLLLSFNAFAQEVIVQKIEPVTQRVIVTPAPKPKEVVVAPSGYAHCFTVKAGWFGNEWIPEHQVCQYENQPGKVAWVEGYWACNKYRASDGVCTNWDWKPGRWVETLTAY